PFFEKSFISSALTVSLCSLWPTLVNTALGVASGDQDHLNVAKVLRLSWATRVRKIIVPSALPLIFTGLRLSLGVGWMVLIAAEMLAQNPGLGKFVWDMFQNGSSETLAQILVAVFTIGAIGAALDRIMIALQRAVSHGVRTA
ncbi:MAG TPA: ABC transporter permease subunit, partial [Myxococcota bacterium]|nr:ABC transporter permease subunit [Myxococcota bacterium]